MEHKIDRLSELPELVLEHIVSFIPLKQVFQLSVLSKRWQNVWTLLPVPEFNQYSQEFNPNFYGENLGNTYISYNEKRQALRRKTDDFNYYVERILQSRYRQKLSINKFKLIMILDESDCDFVNRCIGYAIESNVKEFYLEVSSLIMSCHRYGISKRFLTRLSKTEYYYQLPESVLTAKSITELTLDSCKLASFYSDINLSSLKMLSLDGVRVEDQYSIQTIIAGCPVVEDISIKNCYEFKSIHVSGRPKLMALKLIHNDGLETVEVQASTLQSLRVFFLDDKPCQIKLALCESLKKLELCAATITDKWLHDILRKYPLLEILDLSCCKTLERVNISSHRMKTLELSFCEELIEVNIDTPNLHKLVYCGGVISFSLKAMALSEAS